MTPGFSEFYLERISDETGISGVGIVARGVILPSGAVVMEWQTFHSSICYYKNIADVEAIHGHGGKTVLVIGSPPDPNAPVKKKRKKKEA